MNIHLLTVCHGWCGRRRGAVLMDQSSQDNTLVGVRPSEPSCGDAVSCQSSRDKRQKRSPQETPMSVEGSPISFYDPEDSSARVVIEEVEVEVPASPEAVWRAIATGPGIEAWFVPAEVDEREGGTIVTHHGPFGDSTGTVTVWDPPRRFVYEERDWNPDAPDAQDAPPWATEVRGCRGRGASAHRPRPRRCRRRAARVAGRLHARDGRGGRGGDAACGRDPHRRADARHLRDRRVALRAAHGGGARLPVR